MGGERHRRHVKARVSALLLGSWIRSDRWLSFLDPLRPSFLPSGSAFLGALDAIGCVTKQKMRWIATGTPSRAQNRSWHSPPAPK